MRTVVVNSDRDWEFTRLVRLHALDCYHRKANTWFWTLERSNNGDNGAEVWGGFPENFDQDRLALKEECIALADWLIEEDDERLALLLVLKRSDVEALSEGAKIDALSSDGRSAMEALEAFLRVIADEAGNARLPRDPNTIAARVSEARTRLWVSVVVRDLGSAADDSDTIRRALERVGRDECRVTTAFLLSLGASGDRAGGPGPERYFMKLRQVMDLVKNQSGRSAALDTWAKLRSPTGTRVAEIFHVETLRDVKTVDPASPILRQLLSDWAREGGQRQEEKRESDLGTAIGNLYTIDKTLFTEEAAEANVMTAIDNNAEQIELPRGREDVSVLLDTGAWRISGWWRKPERKEKVEAYQSGFEKALDEFERVRVEAIEDQVKTIRRKGNERRPGLLNGMTMLNIPAGTAGIQQLEQPMKTLREKWLDLITDIRSFGDLLESASRDQDDSRRGRNRAFLLAKDAEDKLLPLGALRWPLIFLLLFLVTAVVFNLFDKDLHSFNIVGAILMNPTPTFRIPTLAVPVAALLTAFLRAWLYAHERSRLFRAAARRAESDANAAKQSAKAQIMMCQANEQATNLAILVNHLSPQQKQVVQELDDRFLEHMIRVQGPTTSIKTEAVQEKYDALQGDRNSLLIGEDRGARLRNLLAKHGFQINGNMTVEVWGNQRVELPSGMAAQSGIALREPGKQPWS